MVFGPHRTCLIFVGCPFSSFDTGRLLRPTFLTHPIRVYLEYVCVFCKVLNPCIQSHRRGITYSSDLGEVWLQWDTRIKWQMLSAATSVLLFIQMLKFIKLYRCLSTTTSWCLFVFVSFHVISMANTRKFVYLLIKSGFNFVITDTVVYIFAEIYLQWLCA